MTDIEIDLLAGDLVMLRAVRDDDLGLLASWWNSPAIAVFQNGGSIQPKPEAATIELIRGFSKNDGDNCGFAVVAKATGELVGHVGLHSVQPKNRDATFGIMLGPDFLDQGYGTDATRVLLRFGFLELNLHRISLGVFAFNPRAIAAYEKAGFVVEGRRREAIYRAGTWHDEVLMGILRADWSPAK